jgi:spore maturation protein CgeB
VVVYPPTADDALRMVEASRGSDLVIKASGVGVFDELLEAAVLDLRGPRTRVIFWDVDAPATLERVTTNPGDSFLALIPEYDLVLTYGGGDPVIDAYTALGAQKCVPIYNALDPQTHFRVAPDPRFAGKLGFLGNRLPDREARVEEFFLSTAAARPDASFLIGGSGWQDKPMPSNVRYAGHVFTRDHNAFNSTPRALLNVNRASMARFGFSPPTRVFEAAGAGACLITDAWAGVEVFLEPDREILVAENGSAVAAHLDALSPEKASEIGQRALHRILSEHTYAHRGAQLDELFTDHRTASPRATALPSP